MTDTRSAIFIRARVDDDVQDDALAIAGDYADLIRESSSDVGQDVTVTVSDYAAPRDALIFFWEMSGGECEHGVGTDHCAACEEESPEWNEQRSAVRAAYDARDAEGGK